MAIQHTVHTRQLCRQRGQINGPTNGLWASNKQKDGYDNTTGITMCLLNFSLNTDTLTDSTEQFCGQ